MKERCFEQSHLPFGSEWVYKADDFTVPDQEILEKLVNIVFLGNLKLLFCRY